MSEEAPSIKSIEHFLALVQAMKCESEDRLQDLTDSLLQHHNIEAANIFSRAIELIRASLNKIEQKTQDMQLPNIPPWEYQWHCKDQPDCLCMERAHYLMTPLQALDLAIFNEQRLQAFCREQADKGIKEGIRIMAKELIIQEAQLTQQMQSWRQQLENLEADQHEDFDPPNIPE